MRSFILWSVAVPLALALMPGDVTAQGKKKPKTPMAKTAKTVTPPPQLPMHADGVQRITPVEAQAALKKGTAIMVDVRGEASYKASRIKGAILIPYGEIGARSKELPRDKMIITYCS